MNAMHETHTAKPTSAHGRRAGLLALATTLLFILGAAPALAGHGDHVPRPRLRDGHACGVAGPHAHCTGCAARSRAARQFDAGFSAGRANGSKQGYSDGLYGAPRCGTPNKRWSRGRSPQYRLGFQTGFAKAYPKGYERGRSVRRSRVRGPRPPHGGPSVGPAVPGVRWSIGWRWRR